MSGKNRKIEIKEGGAYLGLPSPVQPSSSRPAQPGGGPARLAPLLCRLPPRQGNGVCPTLAGTRARHLPPCWPPPASLSRPRCPGRSHAAAPHRSHSPSPSPSSPALSPSHLRTTAATDADCRSHRAPLASQSSASPPSSSSSSHATRRAPERRPRHFPPRRPPRIFSVEFGHSGAPPSSLTLPARSL